MIEAYLEPHQLRRIFRTFNRFMLMLWRLGLGSYGNGTRWGGAYMVIKHTGRKTGLTRFTPLNYAVVAAGELSGLPPVYCTAGFGEHSDWYRNITANPQVEIWLPDGRWEGQAEDVTSMEGQLSIFRQVLMASGFAGPLFGVNQKDLDDQDLERILKDYRLIRITRETALTGPGGPGDLAWIWPLSTLALLGLYLRRPPGRRR